MDKEKPKKQITWMENEGKKEGKPGLIGPITKETVDKIYKTYSDYYDGKTNLNNRIKEAQNWYRLRHWEELNSKEDEPTSAYLFNTLMNKHADAMDNYPTANILPREESDKTIAEILSKIVPTIFERCKYKKTYAKNYYDKLGAGTCATGVFWNNNIDNGLGDVDIKSLDILNIYWQPGIEDIQDSRYLFITSLVDNDVLMNDYDFLEAPGTELNPEAAYRTDDYLDKTNKTTVIDCYYKKMIGTRQVLHYIKFIPGHLLYASENDETCKDGFYHHGKYPVVLDVMFPIKESPAGFGFIDAMKEPQMYIDKMDGIILRHAARTGKPRFLVSDGVKMNMDEFNSDSDVVHVAGSLDDMHYKQIIINSLDGAVYNRLQGKIEEIKETSGNTDYSQGNSTGGVTAASAIAALQEASSKLSRDMISQSYSAHEELVLLVIEVIRQFYDEARMFRVTGSDGNDQYVAFDNSSMIHEIGMDEQGNKLFYKPVYDVKVSAQKASPYSKVAQNELAKELYSAGVFNPELADQSLMMLDMMDFDGKDVLIRKISENAKIFKENQMLKEQMVKMAAIIDAQNGSGILESMGEAFSGQKQSVPAGGVGEKSIAVDALGRAKGKNDIVSRAKEQTASRTSPT